MRTGIAVACAVVAGICAVAEIAMYVRRDRSWRPVAAALVMVGASCTAIGSAWAAVAP